MPVNDARAASIALLFAMRRETLGLRRRCKFSRQISAAPFPAWFCGWPDRQVLAIEAGVGAAATRQAVEWVLSRPTLPSFFPRGGQVENLTYEPSVLLYAGFAGALVDDLHVGDVVMATEVRDLAGNEWPTTFPHDRAGLPCRRGALLYSPRMIGEPGTKRELGHAHGALAVDMESAVFAQACTERGVPFGIVRVISDDVAASLSASVFELLEGGRVSWRRVLSALVRRPRLLKEFMRLRRDTRLAAERLGQVLAELLGEAGALPPRQSIY